MLNPLAEAQDVSSEQSIAQREAESKKTVRCQIDERFEKAVDELDPNTKRTAAWLGSTGLQLPVPPTKYGSTGKITYLGNSVKMMQTGSRNAKLAEFLTGDAEGTPEKKVVTEEQARALYPEVPERGAAENAKAERFQMAEKADRKARKEQRKSAQKRMTKAFGTFRICCETPPEHTDLQTWKLRRLPSVRASDSVDKPEKV